MYKSKQVNQQPTNQPKQIKTEHAVRENMWQLIDYDTRHIVQKWLYQVTNRVSLKILLSMFQNRNAVETRHIIDVEQWTVKIVSIIVLCSMLPQIKHIKQDAENTRNHVLKIKS